MAVEVKGADGVIVGANLRRAMLSRKKERREADPEAPANGSRWAPKPLNVREKEPRCRCYSVGLGACDGAFGGVACFMMCGGVAPMINHSCDENMTHEYLEADGVVRFRAVADVGAGEELHIAYNAARLHEPTAARRAMLRRNKFFECG